MKKFLMIAVVGAAVGLSGCADHPYLTAAGAAVAGAAIANAVSHHDKNKGNEDNSRRWDEEHSRQEQYRRHDHRRHNSDCDNLPYDAPNWQREQCNSY